VPGATAAAAGDLLLLEHAAAHNNAQARTTPRASVFLLSSFPGLALGKRSARLRDICSGELVAVLDADQKLGLDRPGRGGLDDSHADIVGSFLMAALDDASHAAR
jgi:hypothetical protein